VHSLALNETASRRARGAFVTAGDPTDIMPKLPLYWRAFYATLRYAGLCMGEACGLEWVKVDLDRRVLSIQPSAEHPGLKSVSSERPIKPFRELWPILEEWLAN